MLTGSRLDGEWQYKNGSLTIADGQVTSPANVDGTAIDLTAAGTGTADFSGARTFDAAAKVDATANSIALGSGHGLVTGQAVVYHKGTGTLVGGLTDGTTYYVIGGTTTLPRSR